MSATLTPNYLIGEAVALSVAGQLMFVTGGKITRAAIQINVTNARSGGYRQLKAGNKSSDLDFDVVYNGDAPPTGLVEGEEVTVIFDAVGYEASQSIANPGTTPTGRLITGQYLIGNVSDAWQQDADYKVSVTANSTGAYTVVDTATGATPTT